MSWLDLATQPKEEENIDYEKWIDEDMKYLQRELEIESIISTNRAEIADKLNGIHIDNIHQQTLGVQELFYMRELERYTNMNDRVGIFLISKKLNKIRTKFYKPENETKKEKDKKENKNNVVDGKFIVPQFEFENIDANIIIAGGDVENNLTLVKKIAEHNKYDVVYIFGDTRNECDFILSVYKYELSKLLEIVYSLFSIQYKKEIDSKKLAKIAIILYDAGQILENIDLQRYFGVGQRYMSFIVMPDITSSPKYLSALEPVVQKFKYCFFGKSYGVNVRKIMTSFCRVQFNTLEQLMQTLPQHGYFVADTTHSGFLQYHIL